MDDLLRKETERQRRLLEEARKAVEQEKARMRQGGPRRVEPQLGEPPVFEPSQEPELRPEPRRDEVKPTATREQDERHPGTHAQPPVEPVRDEAAPLLRSIPDMRSALVPFDDAADGVSWSKPFSLPRADMEPWLSFLRGYRQSCLFPESALAEPGLRVDAAVQALFELKGIDIKVILEPAVQINGPVEYVDDDSAGAVGGERDGHQVQLARAFEKGREMGDRLYDALLGEGYVNLVQAWEKVHNRKPSVSELHFMLTTGRIKPPVEIQPRQAEIIESEDQPKPSAAAVETTRAKPEAPPEENRMPKATRAGLLDRLLESRFFSVLRVKFAVEDKRKFLFHLSHLLLVCAAVAVYCVVMQVFD